MPFKGISYMELWQPFCSVECNHLCNFSIGYQEEQFCEIILNLGQGFRRRCLLEDFFIWSSGDPTVQWSSNNVCNFERGHHGKHSCEVI